MWSAPCMARGAEEGYDVRDGTTSGICSPPIAATGPCCEFLEQKTSLFFENSELKRNNKIPLNNLFQTNKRNKNKDYIKETKLKARGTGVWRTYLADVLVQTIYSTSSVYGFWKLKLEVRSHTHSRLDARKRYMMDITCPFNLRTETHNTVTIIPCGSSVKNLSLQILHLLALKNTYHKSVKSK